jgi:hypothetical protein
MSIDMSAAEKARDSFVLKYWTPPRNIISVGISLVKMYDCSLPVSEHEDHCLVVGILTPPLPPGLGLPSHHDGVRIFVEQTGIPSISW